MTAVGDSDDLWYDPTRRRIYVKGSDGFVSVIEQRSDDRYEPVAKIATAPEARTSFFRPSLDACALRCRIAVPSTPSFGSTPLLPE